MLGFNPGNFFERMRWLRDFKNLLIHFSVKPKRLCELADRLSEYCLWAIGSVLEAKPDAVSFSDDWGTQDRLIVKPSFWREIFKPRHKEMFKLVHDSGAYVYFHSDGYIMDVRHDLAKIGESSSKSLYLDSSMPFCRSLGSGVVRARTPTATTRRALENRIAHRRITRNDVASRLGLHPEEEPKTWLLSGPKSTKSKSDWIRKDAEKI